MEAKGTAVQGETFQTGGATQRQVATLEKQLELLQSQNIDLQCSQKTLLLTPLGVNPEQVGFYQDSMFTMSDRHPTVEETKCLMDTYVAKTLNADTKKVHCELNLYNWRWRIVDGFFSGKVIDAMWERMGLFKTWVHRYWLHKNIITVEKLLHMTGKSSTEKYAVRLRYISTNPSSGAKPDFNETDEYGIPKWRHMKPYGRPRNERGNHSDAVPTMKTIE